MNLGNAIKTMRLQKHEMQNVFATNIGITQTYLSQIENNQKTPSIEILLRIAEYMKIPLPVLFWFGIDEYYVKPDKIEVYKQFKPIIDEIIKSLWF